MSILRRMCAVAIITAVLAVSALAGQLDSPGIVAPPQPSTSASTTTIILTILSLIR